MKARSWVEANLADRFPTDLCGACAWASTYILYRLQLEGIKAQVAISKIPCGQHAFVLTDDYIIDVTATQFSTEKRFVPEIVIVERKKAAEYYWSTILTRLRTPKGVVRFTQNPPWPDDQIPNLKFIEETYEDF